MKMRERSGLPEARSKGSRDLTMISDSGASESYEDAKFLP